MTACCRKCGRELTADEVALHKKLINRGDVSYYCIECLAELFCCSDELLRKKIKQFRNMGCTLFAPEEK